MIDRENSTMRGKAKKILYGVGLALATLGGERAVLYFRSWYAEHKERDREEFIETFIKKYREAESDQENSE